MYLFDAKIVAVDGSVLTAGRFAFLPDPDSEIGFAIPETAIIAVEVNERVMYIRPVLQATQREARSPTSTCRPTMRSRHACAPWRQGEVSNRPC